jgi:predicted nucleotidyltransferase
MQSYLEANEDRRWEELVNMESDYDAQPPFALGLDLGRLVGAEHRQLVESFLSKPPPRLGPTDAFWRVGDAEQEAARLAAFRRGFEYGLADRE